MFAASEFPTLRSSPPKAPKRVNFDDETSYIARLQHHLTQEEADINRLDTDRRLGLLHSPQLLTQPMSPRSLRVAGTRPPTPARAAKGMSPVRPKTPSSKNKPSAKALANLSPNQLGGRGQSKRAATSPAKDPTNMKKTDLKSTPQKHSINKNNVHPEDIPEKKNSATDKSVTPISQAETIPYKEDTPDSLDLPDSPDVEFGSGLWVKKQRDSYGDGGKQWDRDLANLKGESFDSGDWEEQHERDQEQKELEKRIIKDQWEEYKQKVSSGQILDLGFIEPWQYINWKEEQEQLENEYQQVQIEKGDAQFLRECQIAQQLEERESELRLTPEEEAHLDVEKQENPVSKQLINQYEVIHLDEENATKQQEDELYRKEYCQEVIQPHREEMASQVAWEDPDPEDNISEPGESKPDPFTFIRGRGKQPVKSKRKPMAVDGNFRSGMPEKPNSPRPPEMNVKPAPKKQWLIRSGLTPEEEEKKKKKTLIKDDWLKSQEKLINSLVEEMAKQQKRMLKEALKERPDAINVLLGDDVPARRECIKIVLVDAIERKKARDAKKAAAAERKAAKQAAAAVGQTEGSNSEAVGGKKGRRKKKATVKN